MALPSALQHAIDRMVESLGSYQLTEAREELTERYRSRSPSDRQLMTTDRQRQSYLVTRLPATYAAIQATLQTVQSLTTSPIKSVLDLGAGPGTVMWAVCEQFPEIERITLIEKDPAIARLGQQLAQASTHPAIRAADWQAADLEQLSTLPPHDLILLSYSVGEINPHKIIPLMDVCWQAAQQLFIVIEPGTPTGFEHIRVIRRQLIEWEAHLVAPCPHQLACPMAQGDWCHFAARVERSSLHRRLKGGSLGHEDEKFSYVAASKTQTSLPSARVLRHPLRHSGHVVLTLCTADGVQQPTISKKKSELYKLARKIEWGDTFPYPP
jgi:ribosomal protein RSM22 (predicted rRNA methylase)